MKRHQAVVIEHELRGILKGKKASCTIKDRQNSLSLKYMGLPGLKKDF